MQKYESRKDVTEKYKWDLTDLFKDDEEFETSYKKTKDNISKLKKYKGCTKDANRLYEFLVKQVDAMALWEDLYVYAYLINDQELGISENLVRKNKTEKLEMELMQNSSFFAPELLKLSKEEYEFLNPHTHLMYGGKEAFDAHEKNVEDKMLNLYHKHGNSLNDVIIAEYKKDMEYYYQLLDMEI